MLISYKYKFIFVHIAKTGGTSIRTALNRFVLKDPFRWIQMFINRISDLTAHRAGIKIPRHAPIVVAKGILPEDLFLKFFKFAFVRNPWDLQVSSYHHIKRERPHLIEHIKSFDDFLKWKLEGDRPYHYILDASRTPQWYSLIDVDGTCIVDYIGKYERLKEDFEEVCKRIGFKKTPALPHKRRSYDRRNYRFYYSDKSAELVAKHYAIDIEKFGYEF